MQISPNAPETISNTRCRSYARLPNLEHQEYSGRSVSRNVGAYRIESIVGVILPPLIIAMPLLRVLTAIGLAVLAIPASAQRTDFDPRLALSYIYRNNVNFVGEEQRADSSLRFTVVLPVVRTTKKGSASLQYAGYIERFDEFSTFDDVGHRLVVGVDTKPSNRSSFSLKGGYTRTQDQNDPGSLDSTDFFLTQRVRRDRLFLDLSFGSRFSQRWGWRISGGASDWKFTRVVGEDSNETPLGLEDRSEIRTGFSINRVMSRKSTLGFSLRARRWDLDLSGEQKSFWASLVYGREVADKTDMTLAIGGFRTEQVVLGTPEEEQPWRNGVQGTFQLERSFRRTILNVAAGHSPDAGGSRIGTSVTSYLQVSLADSFYRSWSWVVYGRVARRDPNSDLQKVLDSSSLGGGLQFRLMRFLGLNLGGSYVQQTQQLTSGNLTYYRVTATLAGYPLGWKKSQGWF